ncbi:MAG: anthranilate phosphoribosyltransferase [Syntrophobacterales bacterium]|nr:MAG: anthranilate phosphoribosyltransferase [Syntrophobacterales bacterium]
MFRDYLQKIIGRKNLSEFEMSEMIEEIFSGSLSNAQIGAFMAARATKGETFEELAGAARVMRRRATRIQTPGAAVVDTCGTGGDGGGTFNISTTTAFVVAGSGVTVAKHGNRSVSSRCGSADLVEALGVNITVDPSVVEEAVAEIGIGFLFAPLYHGAMKHAAAARKEVGIRSIFNMLGPLTNPAAANCQLLGVYAPQLTEMFAEALRLLGTRHALVVHGHDGLDEISVCAPTRVSELRDGLIRTYDIDPERFLGRRAAPAEVAGGDPARNAAITRGVLAGDQGACRDVVVLNAAAALVAAGKTDTIEAGMRLAAESIDSGAARRKLDELVNFTRQAG